MISTLKRIQAKKAAQENNGGFTLIELLIVIVVLGILAAVVVFSLGGVTGQSAVAACQADGATVETALAAYNAQVTNSATNLATVAGLVPKYLVSFPNNPAHYQMEINGGKLYVAKVGVSATAALNTSSPEVLSATEWNPWMGASTCVSPTTVS